MRRIDTLTSKMFFAQIVTSSVAAVIVLYGILAVISISKYLVLTKNDRDDHLKRLQ